MSKIISIANQKGGVGKTTTAINLSVSLADRGYKILLIDLDPQGNASTGLGFFPWYRKLTIYDVLFGKKTILNVVIATKIKNFWLVPASIDLNSADVELIKNTGYVLFLRRALSVINANKFDYIFIDCPPALNLLNMNAFAASDSVLIPLQSEFFALEGLSQLLLTIQEIRNRFNIILPVEGVLLTMYDKRTLLSRQVEQDARENLKNLVYRSIIPRNVQVSEAPSYGQPVLRHNPQSKGAVAYRAFAQEFYYRNIYRHFN